MKPSASNLSHPLKSQAYAQHLIYNATFALWPFLIGSVTLQAPP